MFKGRRKNYLDEGDQEEGSARAKESSYCSEMWRREHGQKCRDRLRSGSLYQPALTFCREQVISWEWGQAVEIMGAATVEERK